MEKEDEFFTRVVGEGGHKNYVERFGSYDEAIGARQVNPGTMGFRLASAYEPDAMHSRLGNDALELKVRGSTSARLPDTILANKYAPHRYDLTNEAKARLQLEKALRECMTWIKKLRVGARKAASGGGQATLPRRRVSTLMEHFEQTPPPTEVFTVLDLTEGSLDELIGALRAHHDRRKHVLSGSKNGAAKREVKRVPTKAELQMVLEEDAEAAEAIRRIYERNDLTETGKIDAIQKIVLESVEEGVPSLLQACDELTELLEHKAEDVMKRLCGMEPKEISSLAGFINRMVEAIQMTNDERVQTKENYSRTCMLNTEYVGTMDFKLEEGDHYFMWNKGYLTAKAWLDKRSTKAKDKKKKVAKLIAKELKDQAKEVKAEEEKKKTAEGAADSSSAATDGNEALSGAAISSLLSSSMNRVTGRATGPASPPAASLGGAAGSAAGGAAAAFKTAALKAKINKVIQSTTLRDQEKLDLIQRHLAQI